MAPGQLALPQSRPLPLRLRGVPVFVYHGLTVSTEHDVLPRERKYWVLQERFQDQLSQICQDGYRVALLEELWSPKNTTGPAPPVVVLTFDDGRVSDYQIAYPLLIGAGARAEFFVNTATIGRPGFLTWRQMGEMQRAGMSFQSHGRDHVDLSRLPVPELERQLSDSKRLLEDHLGRPVDFLAVPYGLVKKQVVEVALRVGYRAVCNSRGWPARPGARLVNRAAIYRHTTSRDFRRFLAGDPLWYGARAARDVFLYLPKRILLHLWPTQLGVRVLEGRA